MPISVVTTDEFQGRAGRARDFLVSQGYSLGVAMVDHTLGRVRGTAVVEALEMYRNPDGGVGHNLEVDIVAPESNPFATRLAMQVLFSLRDDAARTMLPTLQHWLVLNQAADGDWHLSPATRAGQLAPWFAAWEHPSINPACCVTGLANRLGIATPDMLQRTATLFAQQASVTSVAAGEFYDLLPLAEYVTAVDNVPDRDVYIRALVDRITEAKEEVFVDASHFWDIVLPLGEPVIDQLPDNLLATWAERLLDEQQPDGGWPTAYASAWRPWMTSSCVLTLATLVGSAGA